jgi:hypothetical protein
MNTCNWKVPARSIYCDTFVSWLHQTIWCHFVLRFYKTSINDILVNAYNRQYCEDLFGNKLFDSEGEQE